MGACGAAVGKAQRDGKTLFPIDIKGLLRVAAAGGRSRADLFAATYRNVAMQQTLG